MPKTVASFAVIVLTVLVATQAGGEGPGTDSSLFLQPEEMVASVYDVVSSEPGNTPDWDLVRSYFDPDALVVLRASREESKKFDVDGFIGDFVAFYDRIDPEKTGFKETVISTDCLEYGNIAQCQVVYEAEILGSERPPQRGLDCWHLMKDGGRWWVISVINESEPAAGAIPAEIFGG